MQNRLRAHVEALCSPACAGRAPGTKAGAAARAHIVNALRACGLEPRLQPVPASKGTNIVAAGAGPARALIGAHYDHLGPPYLGADDNAAAVALLLELARDLAPGVVLAFFDAEEPPHFLGPGMGSYVYTRDPPFPLADLRLAVILDLVGHAVGPESASRAVRQSLFALGAETSAGTAALVDEAARGVDGVIVRRLGIDVIPPLSDYEPFRQAGAPFLFLTCGRWRHYHQPSDTPEKLDYAKLAASTVFTARLARAAAAAPAARLDPDGRDHGATLASARALAQELSPQAAAALSGMRLGADGRLDLADYSRLLQLIGLLEQGLA